MTAIARYALRVPEEMRKEIAKIAKEQGLTMNGLIKEILWDWIQEQREVGEPATNKENERRKTK